MGTIRPHHGLGADRSPCPPQLSSMLTWSDCGSAHNCCAVCACVCARVLLSVSVCIVCASVCVLVGACTAARAVSHRPLGGRIVLAVCPAVTKPLGKAEQELAGNWPMWALQLPTSTHLPFEEGKAQVVPRSLGCTQVRTCRPRPVGSVVLGELGLHEGSWGSGRPPASPLLCCCS